MRESLQRKCDQFVQNQEMLKRSVGSGDLRMRSVCAMMLLNADLVDESMLAEAKQVLKEETGLFSNFRGFSKMACITMLALSGHPETAMMKGKETYEILKSDFPRSEYLALSALSLGSKVPDWQMDDVASRARQLYKRMKKEHPFLTSSGDTGFCLLLALSDEADDVLIDRMEGFYKELKGKFPSGNGLQSLTHTMVLAGQNASCGRVAALYEELRERGLKYGKSYELPMLGVLAGTEESTESLVGEITEADRFLADQKGYGVWGLGKKSRLMHAAMLVALDHTKESDAMDAAALSGTIAMMAAEQAAMAAIIASNAAAASSCN